jgi:hypothetical protein
MAGTPNKLAEQLARRQVRAKRASDQPTISALRAQLADKDREIAELKAQLASADARAERVLRQKLADKMVEVRKERAERKARREKAAAVPCIDCRRDTGDSIGGLGEWYMVRDELWAAAGMTPDGGCLCIECLEARLGRQLDRSDFTDASVNDPDGRCSLRLRDRLQRAGPS